MIETLWSRFQQWFRWFTMLLDEGSSEMGLFRHLSDYVFVVPNIGNGKSMRVIFFSKCLKLNLNFKNSATNWEKVFSFWDNCIWIGNVKLSRLRTGCFESEANELTSSPKIWHVQKRDFLQLNWLGSDQWLS